MPKVKIKQIISIAMAVMIIITAIALPISAEASDNLGSEEISGLTWTQGYLNQNGNINTAPVNGSTTISSSKIDISNFSKLKITVPSTSYSTKLFLYDANGNYLTIIQNPEHTYGYYFGSHTYDVVGSYARITLAKSNGINPSNAADIAISGIYKEMPVINTKNKGTLTIHKFEWGKSQSSIVSEYPEATKPHGESDDISIYPGNVPPGAKFLEGASFTIKKVANVSPKYFTIDGEELPTPSEAAAMNAIGDEITLTTNSSGIARFTDLPLGIYYVKETVTDATKHITELTPPFVVSIPTTSYSKQNQWNYNVEVFPKNKSLYDNITLNKVGKELLTATELNWEIGRVEPSTGQEAANNGQRRTGYIDVTGYTSLALQVSNNTAWNSVHAYDSNKNWIKLIGSYNTNQNNIVLPDNTKYVRFMSTGAWNIGTEPPIKWYLQKPLSGAEFTLKKSPVNDKALDSELTWTQGYLSGSGNITSEPNNSATVITSSAFDVSSHHQLEVIAPTGYSTKIFWYDKNGNFLSVSRNPDNTYGYFPSNHTYDVVGSYARINLNKSGGLSPSDASNASFKEIADWEDFSFQPAATNANGSTTLSQLPVNYYYKLTETKSPNYYLYDNEGKETTFAFMNRGTGNIEELSGTNATRIGARNLQISNSIPKIEKFIDKSRGNNSELVKQASLTYNNDTNNYHYYTVKITTPDVDMSELTQFAVKDTINNTAVAPTITKVVSEYGTVIPSSAYTYTATSSDTTWNKTYSNTVLSFTPSKLTRNTTYYISYKAYVTQTTYNNAQLDYKISTSYSLTSNRVDFKRYDYMLTKKASDTGNVLEGAEFQAFYSLEDAKALQNPIVGYEGESTSPKITYTSNSSGILKFIGIDCGDTLTGTRDIWIVETKAPNGYNLMTEPYKVTVTANTGNESQITVVDTPINGFPLTGGSGMILFVVVAVIIIGTALIVLIRYRQKKRGKANEE